MHSRRFPDGSSEKIHIGGEKDEKKRWMAQDKRRKV